MANHQVNQFAHHKSQKDDAGEKSTVHRTTSSSSATKPRSSLDKFLVPGRTRYPSNNNSTPEAFDLHVAQSLLNSEACCSNQTTPLYRHGPYQWESRTAPETRSSSDPSCSQGLPRTMHQRPTRQSSGYSTAGFSEISFVESSDASNASSVRDTTKFVQKYNRLAAANGLSNLKVLYDYDESASKQTENLQSKGSTPGLRFLRKLTRSSSTASLQQSVPAQLSRKSSVASFLGRRPTPVLKCHSLDDIYRVGGASVLQLPAAYTAVPLLVPTCIAATGNQLARCGRGTTGIFRIPGQTSIVNELYNRYVLHLQRGSEDGEFIHATIGSQMLPSGIEAGTHDVASAFKRFLWDLPGGVLGSLTLFNAFKDIIQKARAEHGENKMLTFNAKTRLAALAILSLGSNRRIALLSAVFGLLSFLKQDSSATANSMLNSFRSNGSEHMSSKALGVIFAPILLGDLIEQIDTESSCEPSSSSVQQEKSKRGFLSHIMKSKLTKSPNRNTEISSSVDKIKCAADIAEFLVENWEGIVQQIQSAEASRKTGTRLASRKVQRPSHGSIEESHMECVEKNDSVLQQRHESNKRMVSKSSSQPILDGSAPAELEIPDSRTTTIPSISTVLENSPNTKPSSAMNDIKEEPVQVSSSLDDEEVANTLRNAGTIESPRSTNITSKCQDRQHERPSASSDDRVWWERDTANVKECTGSPSPQTSSQEPGDVTTSGAETPNDFCDRKTSEICLEHIKSDRPSAAFLGATETLGNELDGAAQSLATLTHSDTICQVLTESSDLVYGLSSTNTSHLISSYDVEHDRCSAKSNNVNYTDSQSKAHETNLDEWPNARWLRTPMFSSKSSSMIPRPVDGLARNCRLTPCPAPLLQTPNQELKTRSQPPSRIYSEICDGGPSSAPPQRIHNRSRSSRYACNSSTVQTPTTKHGRDSHWTPLVPSLQSPQEPPVARRINFGQSREISRPERQSHIREEGYLETPARANLKTLYAEIRRLNHDLDSRNEEIYQLRQRISAMKDLRDSATLSERLLEAKRDLNFWRQRAEWAETALYGHSWDQHRNFRKISQRSSLNRSFGDAILSEEADQKERKGHRPAVLYHG